jgi:hypothetical protein
MTTMLEPGPCRESGMTEFTEGATTMSGPEEFISEPILPVRGSGDVKAMGRGEPGLPNRFTWRGREYRVTCVRRQWKSSEREGGTGRLYLRRHWYEIETDAGLVMTLYCERQARSRAQAGRRWFVYTVWPGRPAAE